MKPNLDTKQNMEILVLAPTGQDATLLTSALGREGLDCRAFASAEALCAYARQGAGALLMAEEALSPAAIAQVNEILRTQEPWSDLPLIVMTSSGESTLSSLRIFRAFSPAGNISLLERPFRQITLVSALQVALRARRRQYQVQELLESQVRATNIRDEFISVASHELKTPLTALKLQSQVTKRYAQNDPNSLTKERVTKLIDMTCSQVDRLSRLVEDMLDVSRISSGKLALRKEDFDLATLVEEVVDRFQPQLEAVHCQVNIIRESDVSGEWDRYRIEQVISNLLTNAMRYAQGKPIHIRVSQTGETACLEIRDEGSGIAAQDQERIFQRFERAVVSHNISGLGLGLFICRQIVESHGGKIQLQSTLGEGSSFQVLLPIGSAQAPEVAPSLSASVG